MTETEFEVNDWMLHSGDKLKQALRENPDLPVLFEGSTNSVYDTYLTNDLYVTVEEVLTVEGPNDKKTYYDRDDLEDDIGNCLDTEENANLKDAEFEALVKSKAAEYDKYWIKAIVVHVEA